VTSDQYVRDVHRIFGPADGQGRKPHVLPSGGSHGEPVSRQPRYRAASRTDLSGRGKDPLGPTYRLQTGVDVLTVPNGRSRGISDSDLTSNHPAGGWWVSDIVDISSSMFTLGQDHPGRLNLAER
jgi:hypothetical protein